MQRQPRDDVDTLTVAMAATQVGEGNPMLRPNVGTLGRPFPVRTNAYEVTPPSIVAYHYDIKIHPDKPATPPRLNREIWNYMADEMNVFQGIPVAYDGRSMAYSPKKLPADEGHFNLVLPEEEGSRKSTRDFSVTIKYVRPIDLNRLSVFVRGDLLGTDAEPDPSEVQSAIQALNIVLQMGPLAAGHPSRAASFFIAPDSTEANISKGLCMWRGYFTSLRLGPQKLFLNIDTSQPMIQSGNLPEVILNFLRGDNRGLSFQNMAAKDIPPRVYINLNRFLRGLKVQLKCQDADGYKPTRKIKSVEAFGANDQAHGFEANGASHTIESYFQTTYNVRLQRPDFPVVAVSKTARWPIELCEVEAGQKYSKKLDPIQTAEAIRLTTIGPQKRKGILDEGLNRIQPRHEAFDAWGIAVHPEPLHVEARELPQPHIGYQGRSVLPMNGVWNISGLRLHKPARIDRWLITVFDSPTSFSVEDAQSCVMGLISACTSLGMHIGDQRPPIHYAPRGADVPTFIRNLGAQLMEATGGPPDLVLCFLPRKPCDAYGEIKKFGDQTMGVATQCLFENKAKKGNRQYYEMNHKLEGGINSVLSAADLGPVAEKPTMLIGADVSHASPGSLAPSVASLVGSVNERATAYLTAIAVQPSRVEVIVNLEAMVLKLLYGFLKKNGTPPERLIFFRDGISEGQFSQVIATEVQACRIACDKFGKAHNEQYAPELTFITCGKRHHISFFPVKPEDTDHKTGNVKSGTVVDSGVVSPFHFDWYSQSHASLLGTGRSAHYTVLVDDAQFTADQLQKLVFNLCFTYARATRAVSVVTPAFYASRLCTRAQLLLKREDDDTVTVISTASGSSEQRMREQALAEYRDRLKEIHPVHDERLFWM
ncbi:hypothetical protein JCM10207_007779 [Rhodosporidiobolus poonsookiae]